MHAALVTSHTTVAGLVQAFDHLPSLTGTFNYGKKPHSGTKDVKVTINKK